MKIESDPSVKELADKITLLTATVEHLKKQVDPEFKMREQIARIDGYQKLFEEIISKPKAQDAVKPVELKNEVCAVTGRSRPFKRDDVSPEQEAINKAHLLWLFTAEANGMFIASDFENPHFREYPPGTLILDLGGVFNAFGITLENIIEVLPRISESEFEKILGHKQDSVLRFINLLLAGRQPASDWVLPENEKIVASIEKPRKQDYFQNPDVSVKTGGILKVNSESNGPRFSFNPAKRKKFGGEYGCRQTNRTNGNQADPSSS